MAQEPPKLPPPSCNPRWVYKKPGEKEWVDCDDTEMGLLEAAFQELRVTPGRAPVVPLPSGEADVDRFRHPRGQLVRVSPPSLHNPYKLEEWTNPDPLPEARYLVWMWGHRLPTSITWTLYEPENNLKLCAAFNGGEASVDLDETYAVNFKDERQYRRAEPHRRRPVQCLCVQWEWDGAPYATPQQNDCEAVWRPYPEAAAAALEQAYIRRQPTVQVDTPGGLYEVDLVEMRQTRVEKSGYFRRRVRRTGPSLLHDHCVHVGDALVDLSGTPAYWPPAAQGECSRALLPPDSDMFRVVADMFCANLVQHPTRYGHAPGTKAAPVAFEVTKVEVVHNAGLWRPYQRLRQEMIQANYGDTPSAQHCSKYRFRTPCITPACNEYYLFHGTKPQTVTIIVDNGFNPRWCNAKGMFGAGVYFADRSSKSNQYVPCPKCGQGCYFCDTCPCTDAQAEYQMLICRVLLGNFQLVTRYVEAEFRHTFRPLAETPFHTVVAEGKEHADAGNVVGPANPLYREMIMYDNHLAYPEFIVHYRRR